MTEHFIDTREQKSPRFLLKSFPDAVETLLESGDWFSAKGRCLVELKIGKDFGMHTEQIERIKDEFYRMRCWQNDHKEIDLHAIWSCKNREPRADRYFNHLCYEYNIWGHICPNNSELEEILKRIDLEHYLRDKIFIKNAKIASSFARDLASIKGVSIDLAMKIAEKVGCASALYNGFLVEKGATVNCELLDEIIGLRKDGKRRAITQKIIDVKEGRL